MIHPYKRGTFTPEEWTTGSYVLETDITWREDAPATVWASPVDAPEKRIRMTIAPGAFWSDDVFKAGESVLFLFAVGKPVRGINMVALVASAAFFHRFTQNGLDLRGISRLKELLKLSESAQVAALSFHDRTFLNGANGDDSNQKVTMPEFRAMYKFIAPFLSVEQRSAVGGWMEHLMSKNERLKAELFLNSPPAAHDRKELTFNGILDTLNKEIIGYDELKRTLASVLLSSSRSNKRGLTILLHGMAGTGKTSMGKAIAKAIQRPLKFLSLSGTSSVLSLVGSESSYSDSCPGSLVRFFSSIGSTEGCVLLNEADKVCRRGDSGGRDSNVEEILLDLLDTAAPCLRDVFLDGVAIDCRNTVFILTANRIDDLSAELLSRCQLVLEIPPIDEAGLLEVLRYRAEALGVELDLPAGWINQSALKELIRYRADFGCRDSLTYLNMLAQSIASTGASATTSFVRREMLRRVDANLPGVRFHQNEQQYTPALRKAILDAFALRQNGSHLSTQEKRALDMKLDYLTRMTPKKHRKFSVETFYKAAEKLYGMQEAKQAIAAALYAAERSSGVSAPILLYGPPGVGKTSLMAAVAEATGRKFVRIQMNGVDSSDYILGTGSEKVAANAGCVVRQLAEIETTSALIYFDEIDKVGKNAAASMLTLFDDTRKVHDYFVDCDIDLKDCLLVASANNLGAIDPILLSRFRPIHTGGYTASEKRVVAEKHLLPQLLNNTGMKMTSGALDTILRRFETDPGIRSVKHSMETVMEKCLLRKCTVIHPDDVEAILGPAPYVYRADEHPGSVNGLAVAGDAAGMVMPISVTLLENGKRRVTGLAEAAIEDSIAVAETWLEKNYGYSIEKGFHIHFSPSGIKKDGSSAGAAIALAMFTALTGQSVSSAGFTGEFDGVRILPVGGIPLKVQAAQSAGLMTVYLPEANKADIDVSKFSINIVFVETMNQLIQVLFEKQKEEMRAS